MPSRLDELRSRMAAEDWIDQFGTGSVGPGDIGSIGARIVAQELNRLRSLPQRAFEASEGLRQTGEYQPGAVMEATAYGPKVSFPNALQILAGRGRLDPNTLAALYLRKRAAGGLSGGRRYGAVAEAPYTEYDILNEGGKQVGGMTATYRAPNDVYVNYIHAMGQPSRLPTDSLAATVNESSHIFGPRDIRSLLMGVRSEYPEAKTISGLRVSGGRYASELAAGDVPTVPTTFDLETGLGANAQMRLPRFSEQQIKDYLAGAPRPEPSPSPATRAMGERLRQRDEGMLRRIEARRPAVPPLTPSEAARGMTQSDIDRMLNEIEESLGYRR